MSKCGVPRFFKRTAGAFIILMSMGFAFGFYDADLNVKGNGPTGLPAKKIVSEVIIDEKLLSALICVESSNNPFAHQKRTGARGLTQITSAAWKDLIRHFPKKYRHLKYKEAIFKSGVAREAGNDYLKILKRYLKKRDKPVTLENLLAAYNWGITHLCSRGLQKAPPETKRYIEKIKRHLKAQEIASSVNES